MTKGQKKKYKRVMRKLRGARVIIQDPLMHIVPTVVTNFGRIK